jgi:hypothetical protein
MYFIHHSGICNFHCVGGCWDCLINYTDKKGKKIFLIYKENQMGSVAKSYMRKGFLIYEEWRKYLTIYEEAVSHLGLCNRSHLNFLIYEQNFSFFFISVGYWLRQKKNLLLE